MKTIHFKAQWDETTVLRNPHKGWYHHYFDNSIKKYLLESDAELETFPGLDHLYLRLAWSYLEPQQGQFNWRLIDDVIEKWTAKGYGISFRISCKESSPDQCYATPQWVKEAGAQGQYFTAYGGQTWRPDYGDPIFLHHLEAFHQQFAARYDGQPWLEYVDIGSYGQWGEGHNYLCGEDDAPVEVVRQHIELHKRHYKLSPLVISDDVVGNRTDGKGSEVADYVVDQGISFRDDSIGVRSYLDRFPETSVRSPELFERVYRERATVLELQHYRLMKDPEKDNAWFGRDGSEYGAEYFEKALRLMYATYIGYHGYARDWLADNPHLTDRFANLCGYWYFLESASWPETVGGGDTLQLTLTWLNRGVAPAYHRYALTLRLRAADGTVIHQQTFSDVDTTTWMPQQQAVEMLHWNLPAQTKAGDYTIELGLAEQTATPRAVRLALDASLGTPDDFYRIGTVRVV